MIRFPASAHAVLHSQLDFSSGVAAFQLFRSEGLVQVARSTTGAAKTNDEKATMPGTKIGNFILDGFYSLTVVWILECM